jgi:alginate O-acetyltransferase complex protein AlgF
MMHRIFSLLPTAAIAFCCAFLYSPLYAAAGEEGLYPAAPPPDSAFIRFLNGSSTAPVPVTVLGKSYGTELFGSLSPYTPVHQGLVSVSLGSQNASAQLKEGAYYTAVLSKGNLRILEEPGNDNKLKAQVILINASSTQDVSLKTADGSTTVVSSVSSAKVGGRSVNSMKVPFSVYAFANKIDDIDAHLLERGARYTVVVYDGSNGKPAVTFN